MSRSVIGWCFTLNNPSSLPQFSSDMRYLVYQKEVGEGGTPHLQGYVEMMKRTTITKMKELFPGAHLEKRRGTQTEARAYAMKEDTRVEGPWEFGEFRMRIEDKLKEVMDDMKTTGKRPLEYVDDCCNTFDRSRETLNIFYGELQKRKTIESYRPFESSWTAEVEALLSTKDDRRIIWVYGPQGGEGKTTYAKHLLKTREAFYTTGGKTADIALLWNYEPLVLFDFPRCHEEYVNYGIIEQLKNGIVQSGKYQSVIKMIDYVEVIVFSNFLPRSGVFSEDRIVIVNASRDDVGLG